MHPFARRCAATLVAAAAALTLGAGSASAYERCPAPWMEVNTGGSDLPGVLQLCRAEPNPPFDLIPTYVFKVPAANLTQGFEYANTGEQESRPLLKFDSVRDFFAKRIGEGDRWSLMVSGTFWDNRDAAPGTGWTSFPFFTDDPADVENRLISVGKHPRYEGFPYDRRCISWQRAAGVNVRDGAWTMWDDDYWTMKSWLETPSATCNVVGPDATTVRGEFVVGFDPRLEIDRDARTGPRNALTLVGVETSGPANFNTDTLCFLVGGYNTRNDASDILLEQFGCKPILQLDGGNSTQLAYRDPGTDAVVPLVTGGTLLSHRDIPHYLMVG